MNDEVRTMKWITAAEIDNWTVKRASKSTGSIAPAYLEADIGIVYAY